MKYLHNNNCTYTNYVVVIIVLLYVANAPCVQWQEERTQFCSSMAPSPLAFYYSITYVDLTANFKTGAYGILLIAHFTKFIK